MLKLIVVEYNLSLLNTNDLRDSFFQLKKNDPIIGFAFDASSISGHHQPPGDVSLSSDDLLTTRLILGSHFAHHLRLSLEEEMGYTSTVGISTNKLLAKLVGNLNKPKGQTTLLPPYDYQQDAGSRSHPENGKESNVTAFIDSHDIGKIPGIGFKTAHKLRNHVLSRPADFDDGLIWGETKESVSVRDVRLFPGMGSEMLEKILGGPGVERGLAGKVWGLINGVDDTEVQQMRKVPTQISIEDSYIRLDTMAQVIKELRMLGTSLMKRMHTDLLEDDDDLDSGSAKRWVAHPKTLRLSTRPRPPANADGTRTRSFNRISRSAPLPNFVFNLKDSVDSLVEKLIQTTLLPMFRQLHPQQGGWNLSLMNIGVTNLLEAASEESGGKGRDIGKMFKRQEDFLKDWKVEDRDVPPDPVRSPKTYTSEPNSNPPVGIGAEPSAGNDAPDPPMAGSEDVLHPTQNTIDEEADVEWEEDDEQLDGHERCGECGAMMPAFALAAHERFHGLGP